MPISAHSDEHQVKGRDRAAWEWGAAHEWHPQTTAHLNGSHQRIRGSVRVRLVIVWALGYCVGTWLLCGRLVIV